MEYRELAYTLGMQLHIPTINIDVAFVEALCVCTCFAKSLILSAINTTYENLRKVMMASNNDNEPEDALGMKYYYCFCIFYLKKKSSITIIAILN